MMSLGYSGLPIRPEAKRLRTIYGCMTRTVKV